jgi:ectoine hydroxylase-related dioxygenase (phytanoyl-CoA dioxygenase family)
VRKKSKILFCSDWIKDCCFSVQWTNTEIYHQSFGQAVESKIVMRIRFWLRRPSNSRKEMFDPTSATEVDEFWRRQSRRSRVNLQMTDEERYLFDLTGFLVIKNMLEENQLAEIRELVDRIEPQIRENVDKPPYLQGHYNIRYHQDQSGYLSWRLTAGGEQIVVEDFLNIDPAFLCFVNHERTMTYVREMILGAPCIRSMELRYRYPGNQTPTHMGSLIDARNRYVFHGRPVLDTSNGRKDMRYFELTVMRVLYALHDINPEDGPLCVVPGSHKANLPSPYGDDPEREPMMVGLNMAAGDAIIFTENIRHGGLPVKGHRTRKTIHVAYYPLWAGAMSPAHWNGSIPVRKDIYNCMTDAQKALFLGSPITKVENLNWLSRSI